MLALLTQQKRQRSDPTPSSALRPVGVRAQGDERSREQSPDDENVEHVFGFQETVIWPVHVIDRKFLLHQ